MRYAMALPVSGNADMVRRFLRSALYRHKNIALERTRAAVQVAGRYTGEGRSVDSSIQ